MTSRPSRFPAVSKRRQPEKLGSGPAAIIVGSLLFAVAVSLQSPARATPLAFGTPAEAAAAFAATRGSSDSARIAELEKGFWICDYLGTKRGVDLGQGNTCVANYEELKQAKFGGDFDALVQWWRVNKPAQHKALESVGSAQF